MLAADEPALHIGLTAANSHYIAEVVDGWLLKKAWFTEDISPPNLKEHLLLADSIIHHDAFARFYDVNAAAAANFFFWRLSPD